MCCFRICSNISSRISSGKDRIPTILSYTLRFSVQLAVRTVEVGSAEHKGE